MIRYTCSGCQREILVPDSHAGQRYCCEWCDRVTLVPDDRPPAAARPEIPSPKRGDQRFDLSKTPPMGTRESVLAVIVAAIVVIPLICLFGWMDSSHWHLQGPSQRKDPTDPASYLAPGSLVYSFTAEELSSCAAANAVRCEEVLKDKRVAVRGQIMDIRVGPAGGKYIDMPGVLCDFDVDTGDQFRSLRVGQTVTVEGVFLTCWLGADIQHCQIRP